jgi:ElaB/YqjD/DUF883 family membrane-anchored ribosome-binding protein
MGKGSSSSSSSEATTSTSQPVTADNSGIAIGQGASYTNDFGTGAQAVVQKVLDFSGNVLSAAESIISNEQANALQISTNSLNSAGASLSASNATASNAIQNAQLGQSSILTNPATLIAIVAAVGLVAFLALRKRA